MKYSDETLMAFADGEVDSETHAQIEAALRSDPELVRRVEMHRALRQRLSGTYAAELDEPVPERLMATIANPSDSIARSSGDSKIAPLAAARETREAREARAARAARLQRSWSVQQWGALAASLLIGVGAGYIGWQSMNRVPIANKGGILVADAAVSQALSQTLASDPSSAATIRVGLSYRSRSGDLCRSFSDSALGGIACRAGEQWQIRLLTQDTGSKTGAKDAYRAAGSAIPPIILQAIDSDIVGEPLDAKAESQARAHGWRTK